MADQTDNMEQIPPASPAPAGSSAELFPPNKPRLSKGKFLALIGAAVMVAFGSVGGIYVYQKNHRAAESLDPNDADIHAGPLPIDLHPSSSAPINPADPLALTAQTQARLNPDSAVSAPNPLPLTTSASGASPVNPVEPVTPASVPVSASAPVTTPIAAVPTPSVTPPAQTTVSANDDVNTRLAKLEQQLASLAAMQKDLSEAVIALKSLKSNIPASTPVTHQAKVSENSESAQTPTSKPVIHRRVRVRKPAPTPTVMVPPPPPQPEEKILSVDNWGGKTSVVFRGADGRLRFGGENDLNRLSQASNTRESR